MQRVLDYATSLSAGDSARGGRDQIDPGASAVAHQSQ